MRKLNVGFLTLTAVAVAVSGLVGCGKSSTAPAAGSWNSALIANTTQQCENYVDNVDGPQGVSSSYDQPVCACFLSAAQANPTYQNPTTFATLWNAGSPTDAGLNALLTKCATSNGLNVSFFQVNREPMATTTTPPAHADAPALQIPAHGPGSDHRLPDQKRERRTQVYIWGKLPAGKESGFQLRFGEKNRNGVVENPVQSSCSLVNGELKISTSFGADKKQSLNMTLGGSQPKNRLCRSAEKMAEPRERDTSR